MMIVSGTMYKEEKERLLEIANQQKDGSEVKELENGFSWICPRGNALVVTTSACGRAGLYDYHFTAIQGLVTDVPSFHALNHVLYGTESVCA